MKQSYQLTDGHEVFETAEMTPEEAAEKNVVADQVTDFNIRWQPVPRRAYQVTTDGQPVGRPLTEDNAHAWWVILRPRFESIDVVMV